MAFVVQKPNLKLGGESREPGFVVPPEIEEDYDNWGRMLRRGDVIYVPDHMMNGHKKELPVDLSQNVNSVQKQIESIDNKLVLRKIQEQEKQGKDRKTVHRAIEDRLEEL